MNEEISSYIELKTKRFLYEYKFLREPPKKHKFPLPPTDLLLHVIFSLDAKTGERIQRPLMPCSVSTPLYSYMDERGDKNYNRYFTLL